MAREQVLVFGSLNMDLVGRVPRMPAPGETLTGHGFLSNPGGKGANQAVACARQGARVAMAGRLGDDGFAAELRESLASQGVDAAGVRTAKGEPTGVALILVDDAAQNCIAVIPGANGSVGVEDADALRPALERSALLLLQLEVPMPAVLRAATLAREAGCRVLLNPAPAQPLPEALWPLLDLLVLNETEAAMYCGVPQVAATDAERVAAQLRERGPGLVLLTLGAEGVAWADAEGTGRMPAPRVQAVDTTAAGDTFIGAFAARFIEGAALRDAVAHAMRAAAICVTRAGAQAAMPTREETERFASPHLTSRTPAPPAPT
jgi:ribokinase